MAAQNEVKWRSCTSWEDIIADLGNVNRRPKKFIQRIAIAATVYFIWRKRNHRLFSQQKRTVEQITKEVMEIVWLRRTWKFRRKKTNAKYAV